MMALDPLNNLKLWPLDNLEAFVAECLQHRVGEVNLTGSNTDPLLYKHHAELCGFLRSRLPGCKLGIRTNGVAAVRHPETWGLYDKASISITSLDRGIYGKTMGCGEPPDVGAIFRIKPGMPIKINMVLCPETVGGDIYNTLARLADLGVKTVNLREPYGQPHLGCPLTSPCGERLGMPRFKFLGMDVTYWDVHYVEVESVNLYANGVVSKTYPITKGHAPSGEVHGQEHWVKSGRIRPQWVRA